MVFLPPIDIDDIKKRLLDQEKGNTENLSPPGLTIFLFVLFALFCLGILLVVFLNENPI